MANDLMRTGPRGSSKQAATLRPVTVYFPVSPPTAALAAMEADESSASAFNFSWSPYFPTESGYQLKRVYAIVTEAYGEEGENIIVGTSGDANAFVNNVKIPDTTAIGSIVELTMNGIGAGLDPTETGNENFLIAGSTGYALTAQRTNSASGGTGKFILFADLVPVSGSEFSS